MSLWNTPRGRAIFGGLLWTLVAAEPVGFQAKVSFLPCVIISGLYGARSVSAQIVFIQALPAALALLAEMLDRST